LHVAHDPLAACWLRLSAAGRVPVVFAPGSDISIGLAPRSAFRLPWWWRIWSRQLVTHGTLVHLTTTMKVTTHAQVRGYEPPELRAFRVTDPGIDLSLGEPGHERAVITLDYGAEAGAHDLVRWWELDQPIPEDPDPQGHKWLDVRARFRDKPDDEWHVSRRLFPPRSRVVIGSTSACDVQLSAGAGLEEHLLVSDGTTLRPPPGFRANLRVAPGVAGAGSETLGQVFCARVPVLVIRMGRRELVLEYARSRAEFDEPSVRNIAYRRYG
jgi:hypothetical protein